MYNTTSVCALFSAFYATHARPLVRDRVMRGKKTRGIISPLHCGKKLYQIEKFFIEKLKKVCSCLYYTVPGDGKI